MKLVAASAGAGVAYSTEKLCSETGVDGVLPAIATLTEALPLAGMDSDHWKAPVKSKLVAGSPVLSNVVTAVSPRTPKTSVVAANGRAR